MLSLHTLPIDHCLQKNASGIPDHRYCYILWLFTSGRAPAFALWRELLSLPLSQRIQDICDAVQTYIFLLDETLLMWLRLWVGATCPCNVPRDSVVLWCFPSSRCVVLCCHNIALFGPIYPIGIKAYYLSRYLI
jgi:hypothetical protein